MYINIYLAPPNIRLPDRDGITVPRTKKPHHGSIVMFITWKH